MKSFMRHALALLLLVASGSAAALGLGEIVVHSRLGQPLLAEIPIVSSDPSELEQLQARLASPETFARVGLEPPRGVVSDLRFMVALDNAGNPVIRVTSSQPVSESMLTFLVEVDWGQGRLVREYSALLDTPRTVSAPVQPAIDAPVVSQPNLVERGPEPLPVEPGPPAGADETAAPLAVEGGPDDAATDASASEVPGAPAPIAARPARPARPAGEIGGDSYRVQGGDTLSGIASRMRGVRGLSMNQTMIALLRANPDAFIDGNVNRVKAGAVLRVPGVDEVFTIEAAEANALVREQTRQWRQGRTAVPQPAAAGSVGETAGASSPSGTAGTAGTGAAGADARLEIVPAGASANARAGNQSGASAGGEGDELRQESEARETLAARDAELAEMKSRLAELEALQEKQQQLIELKDSELAAAQQRLAENASTSGAARGSVLPWILGGIGLLVVGLLAGLALRRRPARSVFRAPDAPSNRPSLADAFAGGSVVGSAAAGAVDTDTDTDTDPALDAADDDAADIDLLDEFFDEGRAAVDAMETDGPRAARDDAPAPADTGNLMEIGTEEAAEFEDEDLGASAVEDEPWSPAEAPPAWHTGKALAAGVADEDVDEVPVAGGGGGNERLELARAYMALGDRDSARQLLAEVRLHGDLAARQQAMQMLRDLE
ncbi:FimV/HubP family polar landmark protein [Marilutibacter spongiae]|uniref:LysM peptidoglycan-binding domain-containing protein n=1 Tax=Marilutibacter spongiae TaxID=2025720 RepID=A0A7W3TLR8_9GAMM|nr:FimV/HubP family polar landmark protein [Lysobacter spongiae]MBB1060672.1 LysM peptidoglycan-binding domain-containing protein [Lysobacter spongiae]